MSDVRGAFADALANAVEAVMPLVAAEYSRGIGDVKAQAEELASRGYVLARWYGDRCPTCQTQPNADLVDLCAALDLEDVEASVHPFAQAMWDALRILGFDIEDPTPVHRMTRGDQVFIDEFLRDVREMRADYDAACDDLLTPADLDKVRANERDRILRAVESHAYNGANDQGQRFYDWGLNTWLAEILEAKS